jgi:dihydrofolate synthase/folylpolyglutamate synthase
MAYLDCLAVLKERVVNRGIHYDLSHFHAFLEKLGNPHLFLPPSIHVAGTNGKGSTCTYIASALKENGVTVMTYTSPHLWDYTERFCIDLVPISQALFSRCFDQVMSIPTSNTLTEFEILTAMAFLVAKQTNPNIIIFETGLGGRLDATNVITPIMSVITAIGLDHEAILGKTLPAIASEKAGIIKPKVPVFVSLQKKSVCTVFEKKAAETHSPITFVPPLKKIPSHYAMQGGYQKHNLALAKAALDSLPYLDKIKTEKGFSKAVIWGRFTRLKTPATQIIIDAAHNPSGIKTLLASLKKLKLSEPSTFLIGILKTKDALTMIKLLLAESNTVYYMDFEGGWTYQELQPHFSGPHFQPFNSNTLQFPPAKTLVITGSIYFLSHLYPHLVKLTATH